MGFKIIMEQRKLAESIIGSPVTEIREYHVVFLSIRCQSDSTQPHRNHEWNPRVFLI